MTPLQKLQRAERRTKRMVNVSELAALACTVAALLAQCWEWTAAAVTTLLLLWIALTAHRRAVEAVNALLAAYEGRERDQALLIRRKTPSDV